MSQSLREYLGVQAGVADTAANILLKLKTVDGSGSGLDADTVDGQELGTMANQNANDVTITGGTIDVANVTAETVTANTFVGDGSQLSGITAGVSTGKAIAMSIVFG